ncbi:formylglycine-generating enzyme family protein [Arsukibacterium sp.]|uniref:formylglycine-generating enzyme family protein n=1 Tax=Arsukibacterium sp. TaxID=1977258 RepID=UPI00299D87C1|nr:formylglycine-generating enzyme family protein [Arsukibacterium sp.]MDX1537111.1 formylglycine-generating enzyme family protein [Arsukibacterium sp.]
MDNKLIVKSVSILLCVGALLSGCTSFVSEFGYGEAATQGRPLIPGQTLNGTITRADFAYPGTIDQFRPNGLQYVCHILDTTKGSHWEISLKADGGSLAIGRGPTCVGARTSGWYQTASVEGLLNPTATLRFIASGGQYAVAVTSLYYGPFDITAVETPANSNYATLPPGMRQRKDPSSGTASTTEPNADAGVRLAAQIFRDCDTCPELVVVPKGAFMMGSPDMEEGRTLDEGPRHKVTINHAFALGRFEVTFAEYDACIADGGCDTVAGADANWGRGRRPAINVSYQNAQHYVAWLSEITGEKYFLPSESEWEYAARAGTVSPWNTGNAIITADANFLETFGKTVPVGSYPPNAFNLYDMHGNVWEWTQDCMDAGYLGAPQDGSVAPAGDCGNKRIIRGGAWDSMPDKIRSAARRVTPSYSISGNLGFRVARAL